MTHSKEDIRKFIRDCRTEEALQRGASWGPFEEKLWDIAELSPFEQTRIITTNEKVLADPYLMRVYLTPEREYVEQLLQELGVPVFLTRQMKHLPRPYLHYFFRGDDDRAFHNHPWERALSVILIGGYIEHIWSFEYQTALSRVLKPGMVNLLRRNTYHRVELLPGQKCWTLFTSMGRVRAQDGIDWGFYEPERESFTPWGRWTSDKAQPRSYQDHLPVKQARVGDEVTITLPRPGVFADELGDDPDRGRPVWDWSSVGR